MMLRPFSTNANYLAELRSLLALHRLWVAGKGESPEADAIREASDGPWHVLSEAEQKRMRGLSEDLNSICDYSPEQKTLEMNPQAQAALVEANEARRRGEWDRALDLLRRWGKHIAPAPLTYLRGSIWFWAGDPATATVFYEHACRLEPNNAGYQSELLLGLSLAEPERAMAKAEEVIRASETNATTVVVRAAHILVESTIEISTVEALPTYKRLIPILERSLKRLEQDEPIDDTSLFATFSLLAVCYRNLGDATSALDYYSRGLQIDPLADGLLVERGVLLYGTSPRALADFELAIQTGSSVVWPYYFLSHYYFSNNRFEECRSMCERGLQKSASPQVKSELFEWLAISQAGLGYPAEVVRASFESAVRVDPSNEQARQNFALYGEMIVTHPPQAERWIRPSATLLRTFGQEEMRKSNRVATRREPALA